MWLIRFLLYQDANSSCEPNPFSIIGFLAITRHNLPAERSRHISGPICWKYRGQNGDAQVLRGDAASVGRGKATILEWHGPLVNAWHDALSRVAMGHSLDRFWRVPTLQ